MMTRTDYLAHKISYRDYYAQFVSKHTKDIVSRHLGKAAILGSQDEHFNDIPLNRWDALVCLLTPESRLLEEAGDYLTLGNGVCVLKEAAAQIVEGK
jgi:hypothetical protein